MTRRCRPEVGAMRRFAVPLVCLAATVALAACAGAGGAWSRAGANEEMVAYDVNECEFYAQAVSLAESARSSETYIGVSPTGDVVATQLPGTDALRYMRQGNAFARCMASRGYSQAAN